MSWNSLGYILDRYYVFRSPLEATVIIEKEALTGIIIEKETLTATLRCTND